MNSSITLRYIHRKHATKTCYNEPEINCHNVYPLKFQYQGQENTITKEDEK